MRESGRGELGQRPSAREGKRVVWGKGIIREELQPGNLESGDWPTDHSGPVESFED